MTKANFIKCQPAAHEAFGEAVREASNKAMRQQCPCRAKYNLSPFMK